MKSYLILFLVFICCEHLFAQSVSSATASATIVTSVGAEKSGDIYLGNFLVNSPGTIEVGNNGLRTSAGGIKFSPQENGELTFINIIGDLFTYDITIQNDIAITKENGKIKIDLCRMKPVSKNIPGSSNVSYPIGALLTVNTTAPNFSARVPFTVTVNFN